MRYGLNFRLEATLLDSRKNKPFRESENQNSAICIRSHVLILVISSEFVKLSSAAMISAYKHLEALPVIVREKSSYQKRFLNGKLSLFLAVNEKFSLLLHMSGL